MRLPPVSIRRNPPVRNHETPSTTRARPMRADAQRNRERVVTAARAAVAESGGDIVLDEVARAAGVGIGTLYRHFPTRQELLEAAFLEEAVELTDAAERLASEPDPFDALVTWLRLQLDFGSHGHSMGAAVMAAKQVEGSDLQLACTVMRDAGSALLARAQASGQVRAGIELVDVLRLAHGIVLANAHAPDPERAARMFDVVVAGIRA
jgi:AcrR family transcriptional regulator